MLMQHSKATWDEAMQDYADTISTMRETAFDAAAAVEVQKRMITAMRSGDPGLPFATVMLWLMEQNAATAKMNLVFDSLPEVTDLNQL